MKRLAPIASLLALACFAEKAPETFTVFAAASLTDAFADLGTAFELAHPGASLGFNFAGSSALAEQVIAGAPADVLATADETSIAKASDAGVLASDPVPFASNTLVLAVPAGNPGKVSSTEDLADPDLLVGLCSPDVPCGRLARILLEQSGVAASVDTEEPDVRALLAKLTAGELDAGLVYRTDALAAGEQVEVMEVPGAERVRAPYFIAPVKGASTMALAFVDFLVLSEEGQRALARRGFARSP